ncbi:hypothetical protein E2C11_22430 [Streptomyces lavendulae]|nr:hypothetical protein E2C11_22430 [Streptomyces lavendulae]
MAGSGTANSNSLSRIVQRYREEDSPALQVELGLLRMLDTESCKQLTQDLEEFASPWEIHRATEDLASVLPDEPGLYMFVWRPAFQFQVGSTPTHGSFPQLLYIGQAGASNTDYGNTIRQRYKDYRRFLRGDPESLWTDNEPTSRDQRLARYLTLQPMEFWCATMQERNRIEGLEKRLIRLHNPPLNDRGRPKLRGRLGTPRSAWQS